MRVAVRDRSAARTGRSGRARGLDRAAAAAPLGVLLVAGTFPAPLTLRLLTLLVGAALVALLSRRPDRALVGLVYLLPVQVYGLAWLRRLGVPDELVRAGGSLKEALLAAVVVAAVVERVERPRRTDRIDRLALGILALGLVYLVLAPVLTPDAPASLTARALGYRNQLGFVALFLAARHAPMPPPTRARFTRAALVTTVVLSATVLWQWADRSGFERFTVETVDLPGYQQEVIGLSPTSLRSSLAWFVNEPFRPFGIAISPFNLADFVLIGTAFALERLVRRGWHGLAPAAVAAAASAIAVGQTRISFVAAAVVVLLALRNRPGRSSVARFNLAIFVAVAVALFAPLAEGTRITNESGGSESNEGHLREITSGLQQMADHPAGLGLGTDPSLAGRFGRGEDALIAGNAVVQVGVQLGVAMFVLFALLIAAVATGLLRRGPPGEDDGFRLAVGLAFAGLLVAGLTHLVWSTFPVAWALWGAAGLALSREEVPGRGRP